jgi:hypothetical protein
MKAMDVVRIAALAAGGLALLAGPPAAAEAPSSAQGEAPAQAPPGETPLMLLDVSEGGLNLIARRGSKLSASSVTDEAQGKVYEVKWGAGAKRLAELLAKNRPPIKAFDKGVVVWILVHNGGYPKLRTVGLRIIDANNEIWQWGTKINPDGRAWQSARIELSKAANTGHWGGGDLGRGRIDPPVRLLSVMAMAPESPAEPRSVRFGSVRRNAFDAGDVEQAFTLQQVQAKIALPDMPIRMVTPQTKDRFGISAKNTASEPLTFGLAASFKSHEGVVTTWKTDKPMTLRPGESFERPLASMLDRFGWWEARLTVTSADGKSSVGGGATAFIYIDPTGPRKHPPAEGFWFGIDARFKDPNRDAWQVEACSLIGADYLRAGLTWPRIQSRGPSGGAWNRHMGLLDLVRKYGMKTSYGLSFTPGWAVRDAYKGNSGSYPPKAEAWRKFVAEVAKVNREHGVISYEIWNEPDLEGFWKGTTEEYLETLRIAYEALEEHHPEATVISGGMATVLGHKGQAKNPRLIERTIVEQQDHYEAIGHHEHGSFRRFVQALSGPMAAYRKRLKRDKPLWFTETGATAGQAGGPLHQAWVLVKKHAYARAMNTQGFTWFVFQLGGEGGYSLVSRRGEPTPAVAAYNAMTALMRGKRFVQMHDVGEGNWLIEFAGGNEHLFVYWDEDPETTGDAFLLRLADGARAKRIDVMGNPAPAAVDQSVVQLIFEEPVRYLLVESAGRPKRLPPMAQFKDEPFADSGRPVTYTARLSNPLAREASFKVTWRATGADEKSQTVTLPANGSKDISYTFTAPRGAAAGQQKPTVALSYRIEGTPWKGRVATHIVTAQSIPAAKFDERAADFVLDAPKHVFNPNRNDPSRKRFAWSGPADLSAKVWLRRDGDRLVLRVDVKDDKHVQANPAGAMWKADSVQFIINDPQRPGYWEIGLAQGAEGPMTFVWSAPKGLAAREGLVRPAVAEIEGGLRYVASMSLAALGLRGDQLQRRGIKFNLLVNDSDLGQREGWIHVAPGIGRNKDPGAYPAIRFE